MKININDSVKIKITSLGRKIIEAEAQEVRKMAPDYDSSYIYNSQDDDGYVLMQLWRVMQLFGGKMGLHQRPLPIETTIIIDE